MNRVELIGNVGCHTASLSYKENVGAMTEFSFATNENYRGKCYTTWINVRAYGELARKCVNICRKGTFLRVIGKLRTGEEKEVFTGMCNSIRRQYKKGFIQAKSVEYV